ncbi:universal stress protein [Mariprofundus ferrooxydans]|uniref:UspA n=1 Tax=Mariprofundus ferrooxydans PV-1 TaxID=314345 RepID=Q0F0Y2_9PROT|nr:universal stress protein [Mariprofundus ferrooxydans]EAU55409.1 UspA [Mariprofundus ferrooxydans PV-1]KON47677.1 UspA [Mariprofundus ferrooxydans]
MLKNGKVLVPTDFSEASKEALNRAGELAALYSAEVHLLHVMEPAVFFETDMIAISPLNDITDAIRAGAKKRLLAQAESVDFNLTTHLMESMGEPAGVICEFAASLPADLIVIGRQGVQGTFEHLLIGSTAERVVRHASCSVLVSMQHATKES